MAPEAGDLILEVERVLPASTPAVFAAVSTADQLARWWGPHGFTVASIDFPARVGHRYRIEMQPPDGASFRLSGELRALDPPTRLAFTFAWEDPDPDDVENLVDLSCRDLGESTRVAVVQRPFLTEARRELHRDGWTDSLEKLERHLSRA